MSRILLLLGLLVLSPSWAADAPPSAESVRHLLDAVQARATVDSMQTQIRAMLDTSARQAIGDATRLTPAQRRIYEERQAKMSDALLGTMSWEHFEPMMIEIYTRAFSQADVDAMITFYRSPAGHAVVAKMPRVMEESVKAAQREVVALLPRLKQIQDEMVAEIKSEAAATPAATQ